jgi:hypothetical protein
VYFKPFDPIQPTIHRKHTIHVYLSVVLWLVEKPWSGLIMWTYTDSLSYITQSLSYPSLTPPPLSYPFSMEHSVHRSSWPPPPVPPPPPHAPNRRRRHWPRATRPVVLRTSRPCLFHKFRLVKIVTRICGCFHKSHNNPCSTNLGWLKLLLACGTLFTITFIIVLEPYLFCIIKCYIHGIKNTFLEHFQPTENDALAFERVTAQDL